MLQTPVQFDRTELPGTFDMITNLPNDWYLYSKQTFTLSHLPMIGLVAVSTAGLIVVDRPTWQPLDKAYHSSTPVQRLSDAFVGVGDGSFQFGLAAAFGAYGLIAPVLDHSVSTQNTDRALRTASQTVEVILACGGVVQLLKHVTGRESPFLATTRNGAWRFFPNQLDYLKHTPAYDAFPSGHLGTASATLFVIENNYPELTWLKPVGWVTLAGVATGLVAQGVHWWSDFPLALALGYGFAQLVSPHQVDANSGNIGEANEGTNASSNRSKASAVFYPSLMAGSTPSLSVSVQF
jgi:membrane-associated phospholipid phosphatase